MGCAVRVPRQSGQKAFKLQILKIDMGSSNLNGQLSGTMAMSGITVVVMPATVMQKGEVAHNLDVGPSFLRQLQAVGINPCPVGYTMHAAPVETVVPAQEVDQFTGNHHGYFELTSANRPRLTRSGLLTGWHLILLVDDHRLAHFHG